MMLLKSKAKQRLFMLSHFYRLSCIMLLLCARMVYSQDTTLKDVSVASNAPAKGLILKDLEIKIKSDFRYHVGVSNLELTPSYLLSAREQAQLGTMYNSQKLINTPLQHAVFFVEPELKLTVLNTIKLGGSLLIEHRGFSFGVANKDMIAIIPKFYSSIDTSFFIAEEKFRTGIVAGYLENTSVAQKLFIYNLDAQGGVGYLAWRNFKLQLTIHADYIQWIGLNLGDFSNLSLSAENVKLTDEITLTSQISVYAFWNSQDIYFSQEYFKQRNAQGIAMNLSGLYYSLASSLVWKNLTVYGEYALRQSLLPLDFRNSSALVLGAEWRYVADELSLLGRAEYRYYGWGANAGLKNDDVSYLPSAKSPDYGGAKHIYLLSWYERPFSQWAVFTDYQGKNVYGGTLYFQGKYVFNKTGFVSLVIDANVIGATFTPVVVYPFYSLAVGWEPIKNVSLACYLTNKEMNLYRHFPTLSIMQYPTLGISFKTNFEVAFKKLAF